MTSKSEQTKRRILEAARTMFAEKNYESVSVRAIAREINIDPALIHHYFGSKKALFATAVQDTALSLYKLDGLKELPPEKRIRELLTRIDIALSSPKGSVIIALLRKLLDSGMEFSGPSNQQFPVAILMEIMAPTTELGASLAFTQISGVIVARYITKMPQLVSLSTEELADHLTPTLYRYLYEGSL